MKDKKVMWYDNGNVIVNLIIGVIITIIICSQSFVTTHGSSLELFSSIIKMIIIIVDVVSLII